MDTRKNGHFLLNGQGKALPQPRLLPTTVRGGVSWCNVRPCSAPTTLAGYGEPVNSEQYESTHKSEV